VKFFALLLFSATATAFAGNPVVKITSKSFESSHSFFGSGVLFSRGEEIYVLTSEHVSIHSPGRANDRAKHLVKVDRDSQVKATYLASEWSLGLALLKLNEKIQTLQPVSPLPAPETPMPVAGTRVTTAGFPSGSVDEVIDSNGAVTRIDSKSPFLLNSPMIVSDGSHGEFGMSGGGLYHLDSPEYPNSGKLLGILSHSEDATFTKIHSIPAGVASRWVEAVLSDPAYKPEYCRPFAQKYERVMVGSLWVLVSGGQLRIEAKRKDDVECGKLPPFPVLKRFEEFALQMLHESIYTYPVVRVLGFKEKGLLNDSGSRTFPGSVVQFFRLLQEDQLQPVAQVDIQARDSRVELAHLYYDFRDLVPQLRSCLGPELGRYLDFVVQVLDRDEYTPKPGQLQLERLRPVDLEDMLNRRAFEAAWSACRKKDAKATKSLRQKLEELRQAMQYRSV
jgi:hypothetical protein